MNQTVINPSSMLYRASMRLKSEMVIKLFQSENYYYLYCFI